MFDGLFTIKNGIRIAAGAYLISIISQGKLDGSNGKFLGLVEDSEAFGLDDVAKFGVAFIGSKLVADLVSGVLNK